MSIHDIVQAKIAADRAKQDEQRAADRMLTDATALERLAGYPEWAVLDRVLKDHAKHLLTALRERGLDPVRAEGLRGELDAVEWLRYRPTALRKALADREAMRQVQAGLSPARSDDDGT